MNRRRVILGGALFILAAVILLVMNRYSSFFETTPEPGKQVHRATDEPYVVELYDSESGQREGKLSAQTYTPLPDGSVDCRGVSLYMTGTSFGDVTLTCEKALVKLEQVAGKLAGNVSLSGQVLVTAVKDNKVSASGKFEEVSYNVTTKEVKIDGPLDVLWGDNISFKGTNLAGVLNEGKTTLTVERNIDLSVAQSLQPSWALSGGEGRLEVNAGGPFDIDMGQSTLHLAGGVKAVRGETALDCDTLALSFRAGDPQAPGTESWKLETLDAAGKPATVSSPSFTARGTRFIWDALAGKGHIEGEPAELTYTGNNMTAKVIDATISDKNVVLAVKGLGPGKATLAKARMPNVIPGGKGQEGPLSIEWTELLDYSDSDGILAVTGDVVARCGDMQASTGHVRIAFKPLVDATGQESRQVMVFEAGGGIKATEGGNSLSADEAKYDAANDIVICTGTPAQVTTPDADFSSPELTYAVGRKLVTGQKGCVVTLKAAPKEGSTGKPITVTSASVEADLSGPAVKAKARGGITLKSADGTLTCDEVDVAGVPVDASAADEPAAKDKAHYVVSGRGNVKFRRESVSATAQSFVFDQAKESVLLDGEGKDVEITIGDSATIWTQEVNLRREIVTCRNPKVYVTARDTMLGFLPDEKKGSSQPAIVKVYLNAGGSMTLEKKSNESAELTFDGGVDGVKRSDGGKEDSITAQTLTLDVRIEPSPGAAKPEDVTTSITGARAKGGVHLKYSGTKDVLEGRGESFEWDGPGKKGKLIGNPAVVTYGNNPPTRGDEIAYDFIGRKVIIKGDRGGKFIMQR